MLETKEEIEEGSPPKGEQQNTPEREEEPLKKVFWKTTTDGRTVNLFPFNPEQLIKKISLARIQYYFIEKIKSNKTERSRKLWSIFSGLENMFTKNLPPAKPKITLFNERDDQKDPCRNKKNKEYSDLNPGAQSKNVSATNLIKKCIEVAILEMTSEGREKLKEITRLENIDYGTGSDSDTRKESERVERLKTIREQIFFNYLAPSELLKIFSLYHLINHSNGDAIYQCDRDKASHHWKLFNYKDKPPLFDGSSLLESISYVDYDKVNTLPVAQNYYYSYCTLEEKYGKQKA